MLIDCNTSGCWRKSYKTDKKRKNKFRKEERLSKGKDMTEEREEKDRKYKNVLAHLGQTRTPPGSSTTYKGPPGCCNLTKQNFPACILLFLFFHYIVLPPKEKEKERKKKNCCTKKQGKRIVYNPISF